MDKRIAIVNVTRMEGLAQGLEQAGIQLRGLFPLQPDTFSQKVWIRGIYCFWMDFGQDFPISRIS